MSYKFLLMIIIVIILCFTFTKNISHFSNKKKYKVALCFYGLTRSLKYTYDSINQNILNELKNANIDYDIILHTYDLKYLKLKRSNEDTVLDTNEWKLLKPDSIKIDNQDKFDKSYDYRYIKSFGDFWKSNFENTMNLIRQFNSLQQVWKLCEKNNKKYDCYLFLRPDLKYTKKIDIKQVVEACSNDNTIYTPSWSTFKGLNDRMALGDYNSMKIYANRIDYVNNYLEITKKPLHAERFLKYVLDKNNLKNKEFKMVGKRIRSNGIVDKRDETL
jgi:hypothetical protein